MTNRMIASSVGQAAALGGGGNFPSRIWLNGGSSSDDGGTEENGEDREDVTKRGHRTMGAHRFVRGKDPLSAFCYKII